jgi:hypothetical protein
VDEAECGDAAADASLHHHGPHDRSLLPEEEVEMAPVLTTSTTRDRAPERAATRTPSRPAVSGERISTELAVAVGIAWLVCYTIGSALEPETSRPVPVIGVVLGVALLMGLMVTAAGLVARRRFGLSASLASSVVLVASAVACPTTGHHTLGGWWFGQMLCAGALVVISVLALRRTLPSAPGSRR